MGGRVLAALGVTSARAMKTLRTQTEMLLNLVSPVLCHGVLAEKHSLFTQVSVQGKT